MNVEELLHALAEEDAAVRVPARVDRAVMTAWESTDAERRHPRRGRVRLVRLVSAGVAAAVLIAFAIGLRSSARPLVPSVRVSPLPASPAATVPEPTTVVPAREEPARRAPRARRPAIASAPAPPRSYELLPGVDDARDAPLTVMRVRMSRSAFSQLGIPIANPEGTGLVDVDVVVGGDGVARSIRRATAVGFIDSNQ